MLNKVILIGNVGKEPEVKAIGELKVATFSIATTEKYKDKDGSSKDVTEWHNIVCWKSLAQIAEKYIHKGTQLYVEGKIRTRVWEDANKQKRYTTEIIAESVKLLGKKESSQAPTESVAAEVNTETDLPF